MRYYSAKIFSRRTLPEGYTELQCLTSTGTQYINTGLVAQLVDEVYLEIYSSTPTNEFGVYGASNNVLWVRSVSGQPVAFSNSVSIEYFPLNNLNKIIMRNGYLNLNGTEIIKPLTTLEIQPKNLLLFAISYTTNTPFWWGVTSIYKFSYKRNGVIIRDMYPALRNSDMKPGMYDVANNIFYTNSGTGEFTYTAF